jgi:hypothetical protein
VTRSATAGVIEFRQAIQSFEFQRLLNRQPDEDPLPVVIGKISSRRAALTGIGHLAAIRLRSRARSARPDAADMPT